MPSIRLSEDVEAIAQTVSEQRGLGSTRTAIEAIVRCYWREYLGGKPLATKSASTNDFRLRPASAVAATDDALDAIHTTSRHS